MSTHADPRPLIGEPLPLDLLNTRWADDTGAHDLFDRPDGLTIWLDSVGLAGTAPDSPGTRDALIATRAALYALVQPEPGMPAQPEPGTPAQPSPRTFAQPQPGTAEPSRGRVMLNETLRHGHVRRILGPDGPETRIETDTPDWIAAWRAAEHYLRLLKDKPDRIRKCANPACPLRFYDVSKAGARRWCSMATCGNRAKSRSHYHRKTEGQARFGEDGRR